MCASIFCIFSRRSRSHPINATGGKTCLALALQHVSILRGQAYQGSSAVAETGVLVLQSRAKHRGRYAVQR